MGQACCSNREDKGTEVFVNRDENEYEHIEMDAKPR